MEPDRWPPPSYLLVAARRHGVPWMDVEDVAQEIRIALHLANEDVPVQPVVARVIINWLRKYGPYSRAGVQRLRAPLEAARHITGRDPYRVIDAIIDLERAWPQLNDNQRACIHLSVMGRKGGYITDRESAGAANGRRRLRKLAGA